MSLQPRFSAAVSSDETRWLCFSRLLDDIDRENADLSPRCGLRSEPCEYAGTYSRVLRRFDKSSKNGWTLH